MLKKRVLYSLAKTVFFEDSSAREFQLRPPPLFFVRDGRVSGLRALGF